MRPIHAGRLLFYLTAAVIGTAIGLALCGVLDCAVNALMR